MHGERTRKLPRQVDHSKFVYDFFNE